MSGRLLAGLVLALGSAAALNGGFYVQHAAVAVLPPLRLRRPVASLGALFSNARWLGGFVVGLGGWALYVAALALAPLSLVQATAAAGIGILALLASRGGASLVARERAGVLLAVGSLALLAASLGGHAPRSHAGWFPAALWLAGSGGAAALVAAGAFARTLLPGAGLGVAAGVLYAAGDVGTKAAVGGGTRLWFVPAILALHGLAFVALQLAFQRGSVLATAGVSTLFMNALPIAAGTTIFAERLPGGLAGAARICAFVGAVASAVLLARGAERASPRRALADPVAGGTV